MAKITSYTTPQYNWNAGNFAAAHSQIATLRARFAAGVPITGADISTLISLINTFVGHSHNLTDYYSLSGYGQWPTRNSASVKTTSSVVGQGYLASPSLSGQPITANFFNSLINAVNAARWHYHTFKDDYYP